MAESLVLIQGVNGDLHDHEGHLCTVLGQKIDEKGAVIPEQSTAT